MTNEEIAELYKSPPENFQVYANNLYYWLPGKGWFLLIIGITAISKEYIEQHIAAVMLLKTIADEIDLSITNVDGFINGGGIYIDGYTQTCKGFTLSVRENNVTVKHVSGKYAESTMIRYQEFELADPNLINLIKKFVNKFVLR